MNPLTEPSITANQTQATTAFLLGWAVSELLGRYRKGMHPQSGKHAGATAPGDYAPRLLVSTGSVEKSGDAFEFAALRTTQLYRVLGFESTDPVSPLTQAIYDLPQQAHDWLYGTRTTFYSQRELRELLNDWSLQVWARLDGVSASSARAFNAGMSLADTFWYLRPPARRPKEALSEENWRRMLSKYRLDAEQARLQSLAGSLPAYVVPVIRQQLQLWSIGTELGYADGKLRLFPNQDRHEPLDKKDEVRLQRALERQTRNWEQMVFGLRLGTSYLRTGDRRLIALLRYALLFVALLGTALLLFVSVAVAAYFIAIGPLPELIRFLDERQAHVSEYLGVVTLLWTILIATPLPIALRAAYQGTRGIHLHVDEWLNIWFITRRTYVPWNKYMSDKDKEPETAPAPAGSAQI